RTNAISTGGIAFRALGSTKFFDTVTDNPDVNGFALPPSKPSGVNPAVLATAPTGLAPGQSSLRSFLSCSSGKKLQDWLALWVAALHGISPNGATGAVSALEQGLKPIAIRPSLHGATERADFSDLASGPIKL